MRYLVLEILFLPALIAACTTTYEATDSPQQKERATAPYYTTAFPDMDVSRQLDEIRRSVVRVTSSGFYNSYLLENQEITGDDISGLDLDKEAAERLSIEESTAGSAIVLAKNNRRALLLTCAHVVHYPDTLIKYRKGDDIPDETYVESVTVKYRQVNFALNLPGLIEFHILAADDRKDLALLEIKLRNNNNNPDLRPIRLRLGNSKNLRNASFVYVMGYPKGYPATTRGIVSDPNRTGNGDFITDALFNRGVSGGLIIASKDHFRSFDWVGMAGSSAANSYFAVVPDLEQIDSAERLQPYNGQLFVENKTNLTYGITQAISSNKILDFLDEHRDKISGLRINVDRSEFSD